MRNIITDLRADCDAENTAIPAPVAVSLGALQRPLTDDANELLRRRFLCRGGGLLLVGPTGVGKSSFSMQCMLKWALGLPDFAIMPARPLKSLLIQAENDDGDLAEMRDGVVNGLGLQEDKTHQAFTNIMVCRQDTQTGMGFFEHTVRPLLEAHHPDLLWIDPALAYLGGEANSQEDVGGFLRNLLNPLLHEFNCAAVVVHHTNKPPKKNEGIWSGTDLAYMGAGSAEWANWARAVLFLKSTPAHGIYELCAGKRGSRLNWRGQDETTRVYSRFIAHAIGENKIYWRPATEVEAESAQSGGKSVGTSELGKVLLCVRPMESIEKATLIDMCKTRGIGRDKANKLIAQLIREGTIHEVLVPRPGVRPVVHIARGPAPVTGARVDETDKSPGPPSPPPMDDLPTGGSTVTVTGQGETGSTACSYGPKTASSNSRSNPQEDEDCSSRVVTTAWPPFRGPVGTTGGSSSGGEKENQPDAGVAIAPDASTGEHPGRQLDHRPLIPGCRQVPLVVDQLSPGGRTNSPAVPNPALN